MNSFVAHGKTRKPSMIRLNQRCGQLRNLKPNKLLRQVPIQRNENQTPFATKVLELGGMIRALVGVARNTKLATCGKADIKNLLERRIKEPGAQY